MNGKIKCFSVEQKVTYRHALKIFADTEEKLEEIEDTIYAILEQDELECIQDLISIVEMNGGTCEFVQDGSPDVEFFLW